MLDHLRQKAAQSLASVDSVILSSYGPADIQSSHVSCTSEGLTLYVFIPLSSDHLLNLEYKPGIVASTGAWELLGTARVLNREEIPPAIEFSEHRVPPNGQASAAYVAWEYVVEIRPSRLTLRSQTGQGYIETIDFS
jgi:hypothetical protein